MNIPRKNLKEREASEGHSSDESSHADRNGQTITLTKAGDSGSNPESTSPDIPNYPTGVSPVYHPHTSYHSGMLTLLINSMPHTHLHPPNKNRTQGFNQHQLLKHHSKHMIGSHQLKLKFLTRPTGLGEVATQMDVSITG